MLGGRHGWRLAVLALAFAAAPADARHARHVRTIHHGDPIRVFRHMWGGPRAHVAANSLAVLPHTWCGTETSNDTPSPLSDAPQIKVVYAYASDKLDQFSTYKDMIQTDVDAIRQRLDTESGDTKSVRFDLGTSCGTNPAKYVDIVSVQLPNIASSYTTFDSIKHDLTPRLPVPAAGARVDYVVYLDQINRGGGIAGEAETPLDDSSGYANAVNDGGRLAFIYGFGGADFNGGHGDSARQASFLHEMSHTQGAVQLSAPHTTGAGHCTDGRDIMCYNDLGPNGSAYSATACPAGADFQFTATFDCGKDDYFNPAPPAGNYLATHWNEYDSVFLCPVASCDTQIGAPTVSLSAPSSTYRGSTVTFTASAPGATVTHYEWDVNDDGVYDQDTGTTPTLTGTFATNGTRTVRVRATTQDGVFGTAAQSITVSEPTTPDPAFTVSPTTPAPGQTATFDASSTSDPSGVVTNYKWDFDGNGTTDFDGGTAKTATTTYATAGSQTVTLEVDYPLGVSKLSSTVVVAVPPAPSGGGGGGSTAAAPRLTGSTVRLGKLLASGLPLSASCGAGCTLHATLSMRIGSRQVVIGSLSRALTAAGSIKAAIKLNTAGRRALKHAHSATLTLNAVVKQAGFSALTLRKTLKFRR